jgi:hypothetical protein
MNVISPVVVVVAVAVAAAAPAVAVAVVVVVVTIILIQGQALQTKYHNQKYLKHKHQMQTVANNLTKQ